MHRFKDLIVWQKSVDLATEIYKVTKNFPSDEKFGIISQMKRSAISIASNIAEGAGRNTNGEFIHFLGISEGSLNELETQSIISNRLNLITPVDLEKIETAIAELKSMIYSLKKSLS